MGIGEPHCDCLALALFGLATPYLGDALPWRRTFLATLALVVSSPRQRLVLTLTPGVDLDLDLVNGRVRDGTPFHVFRLYFDMFNTSFTI